MSDINLNQMSPVGKVGWWIDGGNGNRYWVSEHGDVMRPLKPYHKGSSSRIYYNIVVNGKLRRVAADKLAQMTEGEQPQ